MEHRALIVQNEPFLNEMRSALCRMVGDKYQIESAKNFREAIKLLESNRFDLVVTGLDLPGMDGKQFLARVLQLQPDSPRVIISEYAGRLKLSQCLFVGHRYFNKPCDLQLLAALFLKLASFRDVIGNEKVRQLVGGLGSLPGPPDAFLEMERLLSSGTSSIDQVAKLVERDPVLLSKLLQIANSAQFGLTQPVYSAIDAVQVLGLVTVRVMVLGLQAFTAYEKRTGKKPAPSGLWDHSLRVASKARSLAQAQGFSKASSERAFLAGLLHDVGRIVIHANAPEECAAVEGLVHRSQIPSFQAEVQRFGSTYADIGAYLLALWGIDDDVTAIVQFQQKLDGANVTDKKALAALHVAHSLDANDPVAHPLSVEGLRSLGFPEAASWTLEAVSEMQF